MRVTVIGEAGGNEVLGRLGFRVGDDVRPAPGDAVLIAVSGRTGPLQSLIDSLNRVTGSRADRVGLFLTDIGPRDDGELVSLVELELRSVLDAAGLFPRGTGDRLACFRSDDPALGTRLTAWAAGPPDPLNFGRAELLPDW